MPRLSSFPLSDVYDVCKNLESSGTLHAVDRAIRRGHSEYDASGLGVPGLRHFIYKSRAHVQVTHPEWGEDYADPEARRRYAILFIKRIFSDQPMIQTHYTISNIA